ncbi:DUF3027 domain-containing protein [Microbacterium halophytorum]|uniref:DUF3027 domain-containing protein n=1 Tax=Microbacterium halophytorum TaxID=2067568 RepID=UPI000CFBE0E3|nr:DUF3027 domain-containing protein [Microbacterium halophytorum]
MPEPTDDYRDATEETEAIDATGEPTTAPDAVPAGPAEPVEPDARLIEAHDLALAALREITPETTIGEPAGHRVERDGVVSLLFANRLLGYPGWFWTVSLAVVEGAEPTVLEAELLPGDDALLAPEWVPWSVRLKEYQEQQRAQAEAEAAEKAARAAEGGDEGEAGDAEDAGDDISFDEFDAYEGGPDDEADPYSSDGSPILHAGDVDGVDIDELDAGAGADVDGSDDDADEAPEDDD